MWDYEHAYKGGPMVAVLGFPRPLYPPDSPNYPPSVNGPDVEAYKRTISRLGRWPWQTFDQAYSNAFSHGKAGGNVGDSGVAGFQRQMKIGDTGYIGKETFNALRSALVPEGLPHAGEHGMDATAAMLINEAWNRFKGKEPSGESARDKIKAHQEARVGFTEDPPDSNFDNRSNGIHKAQDVTAGGHWLDRTAWCGSWCMYALTAGGFRVDSDLCSVASIEEMAKNGQYPFRGWTTDRSKAEMCDLVVIGGYGVHVEMVRGKMNSDGSVPTWGGNTSSGSSGSQSNGGGAYRRTRYPSEIRGFALLRWE